MSTDLVKDGSVWAEEGVGDEPAGPVRPADVERLRQGGPILTLTLPGEGAYNAHFELFMENHRFAVYFIQNNPKLTQPQTFGHYTQMPSL